MAEVTFKCEFCGIECRSKFALKRHQKTAKKCLGIQGIKPEMIFKCDQCDYSATQKSNLSKHLKKHARKLVTPDRIKELEEKNAEQHDKIEEQEVEIEDLAAELRLRDKHILDLEVKLKSKDEKLAKIKLEVYGLNAILQEYRVNGLHAKK